MVVPMRAVAVLLLVFLSAVVHAQDGASPASKRMRAGETPLGPLVSVETRHLQITAGVSDVDVAPGGQVSIAFDIEPRPGIHVYAPGTHTYQVISVTLDTRLWMRAAPLVYPPSELFHFKPLDERVEVYQKPFRLVQDVTILATPDAQKRLAGETSITISATVTYQACDDRLCYAPQQVPVKWTLPLKPRAR